MWNINILSSFSCCCCRSDYGRNTTDSDHIVVNHTADFAVSSSHTASLDHSSHRYYCIIATDLPRNSRLGHLRQSSMADCFHRNISEAVAIADSPIDNLAMWRLVPVIAIARRAHHRSDPS